MKTLTHKQVDYVLTNQEYEKILEVMTRKPRPFNIIFRGNIWKTSQIEVNDLKQHYLGSMLQNFWPAEELEGFKREIENIGSFSKLLVKLGAWRVSEKYPEGAVCNPKLYDELHRKHSALMSFRSKQEKLKGGKQPKIEKKSEIIKTIDTAIMPGKVNQDKIEDKINVEDIPF